MAARSSWKGFLKLSLVSIPVKAYTATASGGGEIRLNQLHAPCNSRIQSKKTCPLHGEVKSDEIVSGFEYGKGQYVIVDTNELDKLRTEDDKAVKIDAFISPDDLDPMYASGKSYYLVPDGPVGLRPYTVIHRAMSEERHYAIAQVVLHGREQLMLLRPIEQLLVMTGLSYDDEITRPSAFEEEVPKTEVTNDELKLARKLIAVTTPKKFDFNTYKDAYTAKLTALIEAKVAGKEIVAAPPTTEAPHIINLMDALQASVAKATKEAPEPTRPPKKMAASQGKEPRARKKKSS